MDSLQVWGLLASIMSGRIMVARSQISSRVLAVVVVDVVVLVVVLAVFIANVLGVVFPASMGVRASIVVHAKMYAILLAATAIVALLELTVVFGVVFVMTISDLVVVAFLTLSVVFLPAVASVEVFALVVLMFVVPSAVVSACAMAVAALIVDFVTFVVLADAGIVAFTATMAILLPAVVHVVVFGILVATVMVMLVFNNLMPAAVLPEMKSSVDELSTVVLEEFRMCNMDADA